MKKSSNKVLDKLTPLIKEAKKRGDKKVVILTTSKNNYKKNSTNHGMGGFGAGDLKPSYYEAYKTLFKNYNLTTRLVNMEEMGVEWIINF